MDVVTDGVVVPEVDPACLVDVETLAGDHDQAQVDAEQEEHRLQSDLYLLQVLPSQKLNTL